MTFNSEDEKNGEVKELLEKSAKHTKKLKLVLEKLDEIDKKIDAVVTAKLADEDEKAKVEKKKMRKRGLADLQVHTKPSKGNMSRC